MNPSRKLLAGLVGGLILGWAGYMVISKGGQHPPNAGQTLPVPVVTGRVTASDVPVYLVGIGTVQAYNTVTIRARVDGELMNVSFREGQDVKKGDVLAQIDSRPFQAALDTATAYLARDQAALANARRDLTRYQDTAAKGFSSRQQLDTQLASVDGAAATVQADMAMVENARVQLNYTTIASPLDGVAGLRLVDQGNMVHATDPSGLVVLTQVQPIAVIFTLPQDRLGQVISARAKGHLSVTALDNDGVAELGVGELETVDNLIDQTTGSIRLKARFPNEQRSLWPGQFINARLRIGIVRGGLTISTRAIQRGPKGFFVVKPDQSAEMRQVETGQEFQGRTLVTKGLNAGERVVIDGQIRLQPGSKVQPTDEADQAPMAGRESESAVEGSKADKAATIR